MFPNEQASPEKSVETRPESSRDTRARRLNLLKDTLANSSFVGLSHIASARSRWLKAFWTVVFLSGVVGFSFNFYALASRFFQFPVAESYDPNSESFVWPDITLCNPTNPIPFWKFQDSEEIWTALINRTEPYSEALRKRGIRTKKINQIAMNTLSPHVFAYEENIASFVMDAVKNSDSNEVAFINNADALNFLFAENYKDYYYARSVPNKFPTPCLTFNPVGFGNYSERIRLSARLERIQLFIMMNLKSYNLFNDYRETPRLQIFITAPGHAVSKRRVHRANAGSDVYMQLSMHSHKRLRHRGKCNEKPFEVEVFDVMFGSSRKFIGNYYDCRMLVCQELTMDICGCYNPSHLLVKLPNVTHPRICYNMSLYTPTEVADNLACLIRVLKLKSTRREVGRRCDRYKRKDPCEESVYDVSQSVLPWPKEMSTSRADFLDNLGFLINAASFGSADTQSSWKEYLRKNLVYLHLEVRSDATPLVAEEYAYTAAQFTSDIGGIVGLWLGLSIISAFELVDIIRTVCRFVCMH